MKSDREKTTAVLLLNLGGPDSISAVKPFLFNLFSDREIIRLGPSFMQKPLAYLISSLRGRKTEDAYKLIGGKSPILDITNAQAKALEEELNKLGVRSEEPETLTPHSPLIEATPPNRPLSKITPPCPPLVRGGLGGVRVYVGMRYWHPLIEDTVEKMKSDGIDRIFALSLYPQYSVATTGSSLSKLKEIISKYPMEIFSIKSWHDHPLYVDALVEKIMKGMELFNLQSLPPLSSPLPRGGWGGDVHVLFSAHSLPVKFINEGDPYVDHVKATISEIIKEIDIRWDLSYQSKSGPVQWLEPSTDKMIEELAQRGIKNVLVVPVSFVSDHIETLYEIDILYKNMAASKGIRLERVESLNTSPLFISALKDIVLKGMEEAGWDG